MVKIGMKVMREKEVVGACVRTNGMRGEGSKTTGSNHVEDCGSGDRVAESSTEVASMVATETAWYPGDMRRGLQASEWWSHHRGELREYTST